MQVCIEVVTQVYKQVQGLCLLSLNTGFRLDRSGLWITVEAGSKLLFERPFEVLEEALCVLSEFVFFLVM